MQFGGVVAAPIVGNIMRESLPLLSIEKRDNQIEKEIKLWTDKKYLEVPDVIGLTKRELQQQLMNIKLDISGEGNVVVDQAPNAGERVQEGTTLRIHLGEGADKKESKDKN